MRFCRPLRGARAGTGVGQLSLDEEEDELGAVLASRDRPSASPPLPPAPSWALALLSTVRCMEFKSWLSASMADAAPMLPTHRTQPIKNFPTPMAAQPLDPQSKGWMLAEKSD